MGEFVANVRAVLDLNGISAQLKQIENMPVSLSNIDIDEGKLRGQVENALKGSFTVNINPLVGGKGGSKGFASSVRGKITDALKGSASGLNAALSMEFANQGFDAKTTRLLADNLTKSLDGAVDVSVKSIKSTMKNGRLHKVVSQAIDDTGRLITQTATFGGKKGPVFTTQISENFTQTATSIKKSSKDIASSIRDSINVHSIDSDLAKLTAKWNRFGEAGSEAAKMYKSIIGKNGLGNILKNHSALSDDDLIKNYEEYSKLYKTIDNDLNVSKSRGSFLADRTKALGLDSKMETWMTKNTKAAKKYGDQIKSLQTQLRDLSLTDDQYKGILDEYKNIDYKAASEGLKGKTLWDQIKEAGAKMTGFVSTAEVINTAVRGFKEMYQAVYDIDTAMTNLKKVTNESEETYDSFLNRSADSAQRLGRTVSSLVEQTASWSKLGYSLPEAEKLSELSSIYANVAEVSDDTAVSDIVTTLKAFDLSTSDAIRVVDSLNELGNNYAVSAADLGDGLSKSASAMNAAGTDMYKTLAMLTGGAEITQNASEFGSFLKVASMRIRGMKGALEELGEEVDPAVDSISKVQTQILNLTGGKVNIFDDAGEFRDYYDIMAEIADVYDSLASTDQANLSEILFGKMRGNQGQALIQAFQSGQIQSAYEDAIGSAGSAAAEQAAWMESLEAKTQQFQAAWQSLSQTVLNTDFLKGAVDTGRGLLNVIEGIVKALTLPGTMAAGGGIFAFFKNLDWAITSHTIFPKFDSESNLMSSQSITALHTRHRCWEVL